jgi:hypothetical protein
MSSRLDGRALEVVTAGLVAAAALVATLAAVAVVALLGALAGADAGTLRLVVLVLAGLGLAGAALSAGVTWLAVDRARDAGVAAGRRLRGWLATRAAALERSVPATERLGLAAWLARGREEAVIADLKRRYVAGEVDESTFERDVERVVDEDR